MPQVDPQPAGTTSARGIAAAPRHRLSPVAPTAIVVAALLAGIVALTFAGDLLRSHHAYAVIAVATTALLLLLVRTLDRTATTLAPWTILAVAALLRLAALPMAPTLSDDAWRYVWDGRMTLEGVNPYLHAPGEPGLAPDDDPLRRLQGHPETSTVYPPGAQALFAIAALPAYLARDHVGSFHLLKALLVVVELVAIVSLLRLLDRLGHAPHRALPYAWHPLVVIEIAGQGHLDGMWAAAIAFALAAYAIGRRHAGVAWLVAGGALRLYPLALVPLWMRAAGMRRAAWGIVLASPLMLLCRPLAESGALASFVEVVARFTNHYEFNGGFYYAVKGTLDALSVAPSNRIAGGICVAVQLAIIAIATIRLRRDDRLARLVAAALVVTTALVALGAKAHPWYFIAPLFVAALSRPGPLVAAWTWLALVAPLTYVVYTTPAVREPAWLLVLEWGGAVAVAIGSWWSGLKRRTVATTGEVPIERDRPG